MAAKGRRRRIRYQGVAEAAQRLGMSTRRVRQYLLEERLPGAHKVSGVWLIPVNAEPTRYTENGRPRKWWKSKARRAHTAPPESTGRQYLAEDQGRPSLRLVPENDDKP